MTNKIIFQLKVILLIGIFVFFPLFSSVSSDSNQELSDDWFGEALSWSDPSGLSLTTILIKNNVLPYKISDGILILPLAESNETHGNENLGATTGNFSMIWHNSSINYGSWSFDIFLSNQIGESGTFFQFFPLGIRDDGNWSQSGISQEDFIQKTHVYSLCIVQGNRDGWIGSKASWRIIFRYIDQNGFSSLGSKSLGAQQFNEWHNIKLTRDMQENFSLYFDETLQFSVIDNVLTSSEKFGILSVDGILKIDNIIVKDSNGNVAWNDNFGESSSTPSFFFWLFIPVFGILIIQRKNKRI